MTTPSQIPVAPMPPEYVVPALAPAVAQAPAQNIAPAVPSQITVTPQQAGKGCGFLSVAIAIVIGPTVVIILVGFLGMIGLAPYLDAVMEKLGLFMIQVVSQNNPALFGYQTVVLMSLFFLSWLITLTRK